LGFHLKRKSWNGDLYIKVTSSEYKVASLIFSLIGSVLYEVCNIKMAKSSGKCRRRYQEQAKEEFGHLQSVKLEMWS
jgi:hypothetical protein